MENRQDLLTIKAFAEASGRSQQTIYKQIETRLAPYVRKIEGKKYIERRALKEVFEIEVDQSVQPENNNSFNSENNPENPLYTILREELAAKNQQIERLQAQLDKQIEINKELAQSINADRKNELAGTLKELLPEAGEPECQEEVTVEADLVDVSAPAEPQAEPVTNTQIDPAVCVPPTRQSVWKRIRYAAAAAIRELKGE